MSRSTSNARGSTKAGAVTSYASTVDEATYMSSSQIWKTLTHLMELTLRPLALQTDMTLDLLFVLIGSTADQRRKLTILPASECLNHTYRLLFKSPDVVLHDTLVTLGTERTVLQWFVHGFLMGTYEPRQWATQSDLIYQDAQLREYTSEFYDLYCDFRKKTAKRFIKLAFSQAAKNQWVRQQFGLVSDIKDNEQNYFLAALRGVDKFYPGNGTLAGYIMPWLQNAAGSQYTMYLGEAFTLSRPVRKAVHDGVLQINNKSFGLESAEHVVADGSTEEHDEEPIITRLGAIQRTPYLSLVLVLNKFPEFFREEDVLPHLTYLTGEPIPSTWQLPHVELDDIPLVARLSRSSRKDSLNQQRRKQQLKLRRQK